MRRIWSRAASSFDPYGIGRATPEVAANTLICPSTRQYLLRRVQRQGRSFVEHGGFTERLCRVVQINGDETTTATPLPEVRKPMRLRTRAEGAAPGRVLGLAPLPGMHAAQPAAATAPRTARNLRHAAKAAVHDRDLHPYPAYKDSGVPWLGEVPAHWAAGRCEVAVLQDGASLFATMIRS